MLKVFKAGAILAATITIMAASLFVFSGVVAADLASKKLGDECTDYGKDSSFLDASFLGLPVWYKYLNGEVVAQPKLEGGKFVLDLDDPSKYEKSCQPVIKNESGEDIPLTSILAIGMAILEILTRLAGLVAFGYLMYGGFMYLTSSGEAEQAKKAGATLLNAAIGLAIAISATTVINFVANRLSK
jgi:hypothetical protein